MRNPPRRLTVQPPTSNNAALALRQFSERQTRRSGLPFSGSTRTLAIAQRDGFLLIDGPEDRAVSQAFWRDRLRRRLPACALYVRGARAWFTVDHITVCLGQPLNSLKAGAELAEQLTRYCDERGLLWSGLEAFTISQLRLPEAYSQACELARLLCQAAEQARAELRKGAHAS